MTRCVQNLSKKKLGIAIGSNPGIWLISSRNAVSEEPGTQETGCPRKVWGWSRTAELVRGKRVDRHALEVWLYNVNQGYRDGKQKWCGELFTRWGRLEC